MLRASLDVAAKDGRPTADEALLGLVEPHEVGKCWRGETESRTEEFVFVFKAALDGRRLGLALEECEVEEAFRHTGLQ